MVGRKGQKPQLETVEDVKRLAEIQSLSPVDPALELLDPNPNIHQLFQLYNVQFFWGKLMAVEVKWSPRMTQCAGICRYQTRSGYCTIGLSKPLLTLRPRKDLIETLLHEMIHAFLFVTHNNRDRDGHGPQFHKHMHRINNQIGSKISVYHTFHDEVRAQKVHVWRCEGPCKDRPPFYGFVRRSMNRAPGPHDRWHPEHKANCGGVFTKVLEPPNFKSKKKGSKETKEKPVSDESSATIQGTPRITSVYTKTDNSSQFNLPSSFVAFSGSGHTLGGSTGSSTSTQDREKVHVSGGSLDKSKPKFGKIPAIQRSLSGDISSFFTKDIVEIPPAVSQSSGKDSSSGSKSTSKRPNTISPKKTSVVSKDISSYFNKSFLDLSSDSELLILSPPNKRRRSTPPKEELNKINGQTGGQSDNLMCPICNKTGFTDLNTHANLCLNSQLLLSSQNDSNYDKSPSKSQKTVINLDDSIIEIPLQNNKQKNVPVANTSDFSPSSSSNDPNNSTKLVKSRDCPICGKSITSDLNKHLKLCIESIPDDFDDDLLIVEETKGRDSDKDLNTKIKPSVETVIASDEVKCPICGVMVGQSEINSHLDGCLSFD